MGQIQNMKTLTATEKGLKMEEEEQMGKPLRDLIDIIHFTENVSTKIHGLLDEAEIYRTVKEEFAKSKRYNAGIFLLTDDGSKLRIAGTSLPSRTVKAAEKATGLRLEEYKVDLSKLSILSQVAREGKTLQCKGSDLVGEFLPRPLVSLITKIIGYEKRLMILTPLHRHGKIIGALSISSTGPAEQFIPSVRNLAQHIANALELADECAERKQTEEALRKSERRHKELAESITDTFFAMDRNLRYIYWNKGSEKLTGIKAEDAIGKSIFEIFPDREDTRRAVVVYQRVLQTKQPETFVNEYQLGGKNYFFEISAYPTRDGISVFVKDITERKKVEEALIRVSSAVKMSTDSIVISDLDAKIIDVNEATLKMYGTDEKSDLIGKNSFDLIAPENREKALAGMKEVLEKGYIKDREYHIITKDGSRIPVEMSTAIMKDADGKPTGFVAVSRDISERKRAEDALRRSEEQARHLLEFQGKVIDTAVAWIDLLDAEGNVTLWNRAAELISGYSREEVTGHKKIWEWLYPDPEYRAKIFATAKKIIEKGERVDIDETTIKCKDGTLKTISWYSNAILDEKGKPVGSIAVGTDITEIKKAQEKIRESEERFRALFEKYELILETASEGIGAVDSDENITFVNRALADMLGYKESELVGMNMRELVPPESFEELLKGTERRKRGESDSYEIVMYRKDGEPRTMLLSCAPLWNADKTHAGGLGVFTDITERKRFEESLSALNTYSLNLNMAESVEEIYRLTLDAMEKTLGFEHASFMVVDKDMLYVVDQRKFPDSHASLKLPLNGTRGGVIVKAAKTGRPVLVPDTKQERAYVKGAPGMRSELAVPIKTGHRLLGVLNVESERLNAFDEKDQRLLEILASHAATAMSNLEYAKNLEKLVQERTKELREAHERLLKSERLAAIGQLAAMVGHDLRNPLQAITNASYVINETCRGMDFAGEKFSCVPPHLRKEMCEGRAQLKKMMGIIDESIEYANKIVSDLRDFARTKKPELIEVDLESLIQETLSGISIPENVRVSIRHDQALSKLYVDPTQMRRVFTNLATNAIQAMRKGGELTISTSLKDGFASIAFQDTGVGIPKEDIEKLFIPLFTTKSRGVGLGLPICKNVMEAHGGSIEVESQEGKGSTFTVKIPLIREVS